jgi:hypothetical protein
MVFWEIDRIASPSEEICIYPENIDSHSSRLQFLFVHVEGVANFRILCLRKEHRAQSAYFPKARDEEFIDRQPMTPLDITFKIKKTDMKLLERKTMLKQRAFIYSMYEHWS